MKIKLNAREIIAWAIKIGTLGFAIPATYSVAGQIVPAGTPWYWDLLVRISGLVILDGVFLLSWQSLDKQKTDDTTDKAVDTIIVLVSYALIVAISVAHGEGVRGVIFRVPVGLALGRSVWRTVSYSLRRRDSQIEKGSRPTWKVLRATRKSGEIMALATIDYDTQMHVNELRAKGKVRQAHLAVQTDVGVETAAEVRDIYHDNALQAAKKSAMPGLMVEVPTVNEARQIPKRAKAKASDEPVVKAWTTREEADGSITGICLVAGCGKTVNAPLYKQASAQIRGHMNAHRNESIELISLDEVEEVVEHPSSEQKALGSF